MKKLNTMSKDLGRTDKRQHEPVLAMEAPLMRGVFQESFVFLLRIWA